MHYSDKFTPNNIRIDIEFNSRGNSLPANVTPENIVSEQYSRNPVIADGDTKSVSIKSPASAHPKYRDINP